MDTRFLAIVLLAVSVMAVGAIVVRGLIWLLERHFDPSLPLRAKAAARVRAFEATLSAVRRGLIKIPGVYRRPVS